MTKRFLLPALFWCCFAATALAFPAEQMSYNGLELGDSYATLEKICGEPVVDVRRVEAGRLLVYYMYKHNDVAVGIDPEKGEVADIIIRDKAYTMENGIRLGATMHKIIKECGAGGVKARAGGFTYYVYRDEASGKAIYFEIGQGHLEEIRLSLLPLTGEVQDT